MSACGFSSRLCVAAQLFFMCGALHLFKRSALQQAILRIPDQERAAFRKPGASEEGQ